MKEVVGDMQSRSSYLSDAQFVVIGTGAVGSVVAYRLAQTGASVTIVGAAYPGFGTTGNSFAWLNSFGKTPREYHRLNVRSIRDHRDLAQELDGQWVHFDGGLTWEHHADQDRSRRLKEKVRNLHQWGYRVETLSPEQVMVELEPDLFIDPQRVEEVYYTPVEGWLNGVGLCHSAVSAAVQRYGATLRHDTVTGFTLSQGVIASVQLQSGETLPADAVINAAGPNAGEVAELAGVELPMSRQPGLLITTEPAPVNLKSVVHCPETFIHADGGWRYLLHRDDYDMLAETGEHVDLGHPFPRQAVENAAAIVPNLADIEPEGVRVGVRPMPKDGHPIIGFDTEVGGLYHAVMHSGVTLSAAVGMLVTEDFLSAEPPELSSFRPERFAAQGALAFHATDE